MKFNIFNRIKRAFGNKSLLGQPSDTEKKIIEIIDDEIAKSAEFGLEILKEHQLKEKQVMFLAVRELKRIKELCDGLTFAAMLQLFFGVISVTLENEARYYFEKLKKEGRMANMYQCHISSVAGRILNAIYNREL